MTAGPRESRVRTEAVVGMGRQDHYGADAPDQLVRLGGRGEDLQRQVAEAELVAFTRKAFLLIDDRRDRPVDQVPLADVDRIDRLQAERVDDGILGADVELGGVLEGQRDDVADRVLRFLGQILVAFGSSWAGGQREQHGEEAEPRTPTKSFHGVNLRCRVVRPAIQA